MGVMDDALAELDPQSFIEVFVPGRICLIGEHSDWAGHYRRFNSDVEKGYCIVSGTNQGLYARVYPHPNRLIMRCVVDTGEVYEDSLPMDPAVLRQRAQEGGFFAYCAGVAACMMVHYQIQGLVIDNYKTDLPVKKGLSSSAAVTVLVARAFNRVYDIKLTVRGEMELAYLGEIMTPSRCGRMDQCCAFGQNLVLMTFDGDLLDTEVIDIKGQLHVVIVDLKAAKDTKVILAQLNKAYPYPTDEVESSVHQMLGPINKDLIERCMAALQEGDQPAVGRIMTEFQAQFDRHMQPACPSQLTAPVLHKVLQYPPLQPLVWGGKGIGSQGDGCAQFLAKSPEDQQRVMEIVTRDLGMACLTLTLGASHEIRKAVIPVAGYQCNLFPANVTGTGMFPIVSADGLCKPAILLLVEEAVCAGVEEVAVVIHPEDEEVYRRLFHDKPSVAKYNRLTATAQAYSQRILELGKKVRLVVQKENTGFGGAVLEAAAALGESNFLLMLGDHLYQSRTHESCVQQVIGKFSGTPLVAMKWTDADSVQLSGALTGRWDARTGMLDATQIVEKPTPEFARLNMLPPPPPAAAGAATGDCLTVFGLYALTPTIFRILRSEKDSGKTELCFTAALDRLRKEQGVQGYLVEGTRYDFGNPQSYKDTLAALSP